MMAGDVPAAAPDMAQRSGVAVCPGAGQALRALAARIALCRRCHTLPHGPFPVAILSDRAPVALCGQAPGLRVHRSGRPFTDPSGERLRRWMGWTHQQFYDPARLAIVPMGLCYPGTHRAGADLPPRAECRQSWHDAIFAQLAGLRLIVAVGRHALDYHIGARPGERLADILAAFRHHLTGRTSRHNIPVLPLPHPSWRNNRFLRDHPFVEAQIVPELRRCLARATDGVMPCGEERPVPGAQNAERA